MPLFTSGTVSLPYIDVEPSAAALDAANALIQAELALEHTTTTTETLHPSIPAARASQFSELIVVEHERLSSGDAPKIAGIDLTRYEAGDPPRDGDRVAWKANLERAYTSAEYLRSREVNLGLLERYGKNAWLIGNSGLEDVLRDVERELEVAKREVEDLEQTRRRTQQDASGELRSLEESWRTGVGRMIETQAAAEGLRQQILEKRRQRATA
nr:pre-mrna-splicing factor spf27 [Quercus suber]